MLPFEHIAYSITRVDGEAVFLVDLGGVSKYSNAVCREVYEKHPGRLIYVLMDFGWDEMLHRDGEFLCFRKND